MEQITGQSAETENVLSGTAGNPVFADARARYLALSWLRELHKELTDNSTTLEEVASFEQDGDEKRIELEVALAEISEGLLHVEATCPFLFSALNSDFPIRSAIVDTLFTEISPLLFDALKPELHATLLAGIRTVQGVGGSGGWNVEELLSGAANEGLSPRFAKALQGLPEDTFQYDVLTAASDEESILTDSRMQHLHETLPPAEVEEIARFRRELELSSKELLDLGLRSNPRINFKPSRGHRSVSIQAGSERTTDVFRILVQDGQRMAFDAAPEEIENFDPELPGQPPETHEEVDTFNDLQLQTEHGDHNLQQRLRQTAKHAEMYLESHGSNALYLNLGMLHWREADERGAAHGAPLIMVPVTLTRSGPMQRFRVQWSGEEIVTNDSLIAKMKTLFGLELPEIPSSEQLNAGKYLQAVQHTIDAFLDGVERNAPLLRVQKDEMHLAVCREGRGLLLRDIKEESWQSNPPYENRIVRALLGKGFSARDLTNLEQGRLDDHVDLASLCTVVDVDSSQLAVVLHSEFKDLDVEGPPGCGKTQTILNIISQAMATGKTVLIVSEKPVALEVIQRKLEEIGLGEFCLELHSDKTSKKHVIEQLRRSVAAGKPIPQHTEEDHAARVTALQKSLNAHRDALKEEIRETGVSPYEAMGMALTLKQQYPNSNPLHGPFKSWDADTYVEAVARAGLLDQVVIENGLPRQNPFWGSRLTVLENAAAHGIEQQVESTAEALITLQKCAAALFEKLHLDTDVPAKRLDATVAALGKIVAMPEVPGVAVASDHWRESSETIDNLLISGQYLERVRQKHDAQLTSAAWSEDVAALNKDFQRASSKWYGMLTPSYARAIYAFAGLSSSWRPVWPSTGYEITSDIQAAQEHSAFLSENASVRDKVFGSAWQGVESDWNELEAVASWCVDFHASHLGEREFDSLLAIAASDELRAQLTDGFREVHEALAKYQNERASLLESLDFSPEVRERRFSEQNLSEHAKLLGEWIDSNRQLTALVRVNEQLERVEDTPLACLGQHLLEHTSGQLQLVEALQLGWYQSLADESVASRVELDLFRHEAQEELVQEFRKHDRLMIHQNIDRLTVQLYEQTPRKVAGGRLEFLMKQLAKERGHCETRQLMVEGGVAVQKYARIFLASPGSIPKFIPPEVLAFDHGLVDEGSQMPPIHLLPVALRVALLSAFGDQKQLSPLRVFEGEKDRVSEDEKSVLGQRDNALEMMAEAGAKVTHLEGHYRSRHESNIRVSNRRFYGNRLRVYPSPWKQREGLGLRHRHVIDGDYDYGGTSTNVIEARAIAQAALEHARTTPQLSLGIGTFSVAQMEVVDNEIEKIRIAHPEFDEFLKRHADEGGDEHLFVKNHENIQGDERDIIFVSVGYGFHQQEDDSRRMRRQFGSVNKEGGEKGLNTLFTRSRLSTVIFSNFRAGDLEPIDTLSEGVQSLHAFLEDAEFGDQNPTLLAEQRPSAAIEDFLAEELRRRGHVVEVGVGEREGRVNLAIQNPLDPDHKILGILLDDQYYQNARTTRDHDRIKFDILELNGWNLHQCWTPEVFQDAAAAVDRIEAALEKAVAGEVTHNYESIDRTPYKTPREAAGPVSIDILRGLPYQRATLTTEILPRDCDAVQRHHLRAALEAIVRTEHPVHEDICKRRLKEHFNRNLPARLEREYLAVVEEEVRAGVFERRDSVLFNPERKEVVVRNRNTEDFGHKVFSEVPAEEVEGALELVVLHSCGIRPEDTPKAVSQVLGFQSEASGSAELVGSFVECGVNSGLFVNVNGYLQLAESLH